MPAGWRQVSKSKLVQSCICTALLSAGETLDNGSRTCKHAKPIVDMAILPAGLAKEDEMENILFASKPSAGAAILRV